jgi:hypothetical protein
MRREVILAVLAASCVSSTSAIGRHSVKHVSPPLETSLFSSHEALGGGYVWGQAVGVTSIVFGSDPPNTNSPAQIVIFTGLLRITKAPATSLPDGRRQIALSFDSQMPNGVLAVRSASTSMGYVKVAVDPDEAARSTGLLTEIPLTLHPRSLNAAAHTQLLSTTRPHESADGHAQLYLRFEPGQDWHGPPFSVLRNKDPVLLAGHIHHVPPVTSAIKLERNMTPAMLRDIVSAMPDADKWVGANKTPIALLDETGTPRAWFTANVHVTTLTGVCGDGRDNDLDGRVDEERPNNLDDDGDGYIDEDATCPKP